MLESALILDSLPERTDFRCRQKVPPDSRPQARTVPHPGDRLRRVKKLLQQDCSGPRESSPAAAAR
jgi:hypothetical protein